MLNMEEQLEFIRLLSLDSESGFTQSAYFLLAIEKLSTLLNSPFIIFTVVYNDKKNKKSQFKSHCYTSTNEQVTNEPYTVNIENKHQPDTLCILNNTLDEIKQTKSQLFLSLLNKTDFSDSQHNSFSVLPFYLDDELIGMISYQVELTTQHIEKNTALYQFIHSVFFAVYKNTRKRMEINTLQTVLNLMPQRVFWKNKNSTYLGCNKAFANDANLQLPNDIVGLTDFDVFPEQAELYRADDANTMNTKEHLIGSEEPQTHANGNTIWLRTSKRPIINALDEVVGVVGTYDDITELKSTQEELLKARNELEEKVNARTLQLRQTNKKLELAFDSLKSTQEQLIESEKMAALGNLVVGVAHAINTPIGIAVTGASNLEHTALAIKKSVESGKINRSFFVKQCNDLIDNSDIILRNLERASELVRNFQMIAVDQSTDETRSIKLFKYLNDVISTMSSRANYKNIKVFLSGDESLEITTYTGTIAQVVTSLIDNALTHAFNDLQSGQIKVSFKVRKGILELIIQDNGCGIEQSDIDKIFEPFYTTKIETGSGLGLSILYNLVTQSLKGTVTCKSTRNELTQFIVTLPI